MWWQCAGSPLLGTLYLRNNTVEDNAKQEDQANRGHTPEQNNDPVGQHKAHNS